MYHIEEEKIISGHGNCYYTSRLGPQSVMQLRGFLAKWPNYVIIVLSYSIKTEFSYSDDLNVLNSGLSRLKQIVLNYCLKNCLKQSNLNTV